MTTLQRLNVNEIMRYVKKVQTSMMQQAIKNKDPIAFDKFGDQKRIMPILYLRYMLKTLELAFIIVNICYFIGLGWYTLCMIE